MLHPVLGKLVLDASRRNCLVFLHVIHKSLGAIGRCDVFLFFLLIGIIVGFQDVVFQEIVEKIFVLTLLDVIPELTNQNLVLHPVLGKLVLDANRRDCLVFLHVIQKSLCAILCGHTSRIKL